MHPRRAWYLRLAVALVSPSLFLAGCGGLAPLPSEGGPRWVKLESESFVLYTDLPPGKAQETLARAEGLFTGLLHSGWPTEGVIHLKLNLVVFADRRDFTHFGGTSLGGYYLHQALFEPMVVMPAPSFGRGLMTLAHELTHYISMQSLQNQPSWLAEGLAGYYETARYDREGRFVVGGVDHARLRAVQTIGRMPTAELMAPQPGAFGSARFYSTAWLLVHLLMSNHAEEFADYQRALGRSVDHARAWEAAFGGLDHAALDRALRDYGQSAAFATYSFRVPEAAMPGTPHRMPNADVSALRALIHSTCPECDGEDAEASARLEVLDAFEQQPGHLRATAIRVRYLSETLTDSSKDELRSATEAYPEQWLGWLMLAQAESRPGGDASEAERALARALRLSPHQPYALILSAYHHAARGESAAALARLDEVASLQPSNPGLMLASVEVLATLGECERAEERFDLARGSAHARISLEAETALRRELAACERFVRVGGDGAL